MCYSFVLFSYFFLSWLFVFAPFTTDAVAFLGVVAVSVSPAYRGYGLDVFAESERLLRWSHGLVSCVRTEIFSLRVLR